MRHIGYPLKAVMLVLLVFIAVNHAAFPLLKASIAGSQFRAVVAASASDDAFRGKRVTLFIGNSRIMGGIDPKAVMAGSAGRVAYNLAYNGLYLEDLLLLLDAFIHSCDCTVESVYANPDIFSPWEDEGEVTDLQRFLSALYPGAMQAVRQKDAVYAAILQLFPLLHFDNEFFLRALYYRLTGRSDQGYANDFSFAVTPGVVRRLADLTQVSRPDISAVKKCAATLAGSGIRLVLIEPPYHAIYIENVPGFAETHAAMEKALAGAGVAYFDHSRIFEDYPELFADPLHLNRAGQKRYSSYLAGLVQPGT